MSHYNNFIDELFTLDIRAKERFVDNGRVLCNEEYDPDPAHNKPEDDILLHPKTYYRAYSLT